MRRGSGLGDWVKVSGSVNLGLGEYHGTEATLTLPVLWEECLRN